MRTHASHLLNTGHSVKARSRNQLPTASKNAFFCVLLCHKALTIKQCVSLTLLCYTSLSTMLLRRFYVVGNNTVYLGLRVQCLIFFSDISQICIVSMDFNKSVQYQISRKSVYWEPGGYMRSSGTGGPTDLPKLISAFRNCREGA